jgi:predicted outer membrane lipoprotein
MSLILWSILAWLAACSVAAVVALALEHRQRRAEAIRRAKARHPMNGPGRWRP